MLGLINPGDEVILFAPFYDSYEATLSTAGAKVKSITLRPPDFSVPLDELKSTVSKNTHAILVNTPHNPTGKMFTQEELERISSLCIENDILVFSEEVNDKLAFEAEHISIASLPGMFERTVDSLSFWVNSFLRTTAGLSFCSSPQSKPENGSLSPILLQNSIFLRSLDGFGRFWTPLHLIFQDFCDCKRCRVAVVTVTLLRVC